MNAEDQSLARAVVRRLCSETAGWSDERLDADPICQWVECLFRKVRDEVGAELATMRERVIADGKTMGESAAMVERLLAENARLRASQAPGPAPKGARDV